MGFGGVGCWEEVGDNLQMMAVPTADRCAIRFVERNAALEACEKSKDCGGVTRDNGIMCSRDLLRFELRTSQPDDEPHHDIRSWQLHRRPVGMPAGGKWCHTKRNNASGEHRFALHFVSYATREPYLATQAKMTRSIARYGGVQSVGTWNEDSFLALISSWNHSLAWEPLDGSRRVHAPLRVPGHSAPSPAYHICSANTANPASAAMLHLARQVCRGESIITYHTQLHSVIPPHAVDSGMTLQMLASVAILAKFTVLVY
jgi:hypothetical protein